ncbi:uncharacterized protein LOC141652381 [Silene latifolia]|uniref:uncharacterized protein LOC141652381 n=1 Tax=Silene latifolia TaxID=37657 RepID=UPI003D789BB4
MSSHPLCVLCTHIYCICNIAEQIVKEHGEFYTDFGNITINWLKVKRDQTHYPLSERMLLKTAFHGVKTWSVFANVDWTPPDHPPKALSIPVRKPQLNMANHEHVLNLQVSNHPSTNFEIKAGDNPSPGNFNISKSKSGKKKRSHRDVSNVMQSEFVGTSIGCEMRKKKMRYGCRDTAAHVHNASSASTDAKGTPALLGQLEGTGKISCSIIDPESVVHNADAIFQAPPKKGKGKKKGSDEANMRNLTKQTIRKSKRKKHDHPSSNLMTVEKGNENERISLVSHQLQSEVHEAEQTKVIGVESFRPPQLSTPRVNGENASVKPKKRMQKKRSNSGGSSSTVHTEQQLNANTQKTVVEQADLTPNHKVNDVDSQEKVSLHEKTHDGSTEEVRQLDNQPPTNLKSKKLDGQNLIIPNTQVSERNAQLQNNVQESEVSGQLGTKPLPLHQISQHEEHLNVQSVEVVKPVEKTPTFSVNHQPEAEQRDFLQTNGTSNATNHRTGKSASEGLYNDLNDIPWQEDSSNLAEMASPKTLRASEQKVRNTDLPMSAVAEFKEENLTISTSSKQVMKSQVPLGDTVNSGARKPGQNNPARKNGVLRPNLNARRKSSATSSLISVKSAKTIHKKKNQETVPSHKNMGMPVSSLGFVGFFCDSPDIESERSGSSIGTLDDSSSADSSEGESEGDKVTSQHEAKGSGSARDEKKLDMSALKGMDVASVLRRSCLYKSKQAAFQSQMEDGETEPLKSVPDSCSD